MKLPFEKYQGTGNDFVMIDCTQQNDFHFSNKKISQICDRRFGVGADGVIAVYRHPSLHFRMQYFNADGSSSFCGNGARCAVQFAKSLNLLDTECEFEAIDGKHTAKFENQLISLKMRDVDGYKKNHSDFIIQTGSPHYIRFTNDLSKENIFDFGQQIRYSKTFKEQGINVNLVEEMEENNLQMLTYERGVEEETYSCGTGATAAALAYSLKKNLDTIQIQIQVKGGELKVKAKRTATGFKDIYLIGPAKKAFEGTYYNNSH